MQIEATRRLILAGDEDSIPTSGLLAVLLGSEEAARNLLKSFGTLGSLEEASVAELISIPRVGRKRAAELRAALTLLRRRGVEPPFRGKAINCSSDVSDMLTPMIRHERREVLILLALDVRNRLIRSPIIAAIGSLTASVVEPRDLLRPLITAAAASTILAHNHPSCCPEPSSEDINLSRIMFEACALIGVRLLDHVVIGDGDHVSLADRGLL